MSRRELTRVEVMARFKARTLSLGAAARMLSVSYRQVKRLWRRYRDQGAKGLQHRAVGEPSNRATPPAVQERVLGLIRENMGAAKTGSYRRSFYKIAAPHAERPKLDGGAGLNSRSSTGDVRDNPRTGLRPAATRRRPAEQSPGYLFKGNTTPSEKRTALNPPP
jgi:hypothetical protein